MISNPLIIVEWILAIVIVIGSTYLFFPVLSGVELINSASPIAHAIASTIGLLALASISLFSGLLLVAGITKRKVKWRSAALFISGLVRLYAFLAGVLINGLVPLTWLSSFALMLITFYIWGRIRKRGIE